ncbi:MAG: hypothetical protein ACI4EV_04985 [Lachnospiraceae bacterium]
MHKRTNKLICVLITLLVFISGMCFENIKVDSVLERATVRTADAYILPVDAVMTDTTACTTEMLGIGSHTALTQLSVGFATTRVGARLIQYLLGQNIFSLCEGKSYTSFEAIRVISENQHKLVVNYIHKSDGKKRI